MISVVCYRKKNGVLVEAFQEEHEEMCLHGVVQPSILSRRGTSKDGMDRSIPFPFFFNYGILIGEYYGQVALPQIFLEGMSRFFGWGKGVPNPIYCILCFFVLVWMFMDKG